ncbi:hypothetical protein D9M71_656950 [compost metagenome]
MQKHRAGFRDPIVVLVAQQSDAVGAGHPGSGTPHEFLHDPAANAFAVFGFGGCIGFRDQHIAIGQYIKPARVIQVFGKSGHLGAIGGDGLRTLRPADGRGDVHGRDQGFVGFWQLRRRTGAVGDLQAGGPATSGEPSAERDNENERGRAHTVFPMSALF